ncbi:MAG: von Willebrand factor type A domain-containing protein [Phycisphaerae bacterium]|nr:von Willebrand factor type A domain-containing protein [Phycisphaerae bacterium]
MNHEQAEKLLGAMIFDDLDEASKVRLMTYLETDPDLRESLADLRMALKVTTHAVQHGPEPVLSDTRLKRLEKLSLSRSHPRIMLFARWVAVAACIVIVLGIVWMPSLNRVRRYVQEIATSPASDADASDPTSMPYRRNMERLADREESMPRMAGSGEEVPGNAWWYREEADGAMVNGPALRGGGSSPTQPRASRSYYSRQSPQQMQWQDARQELDAIVAGTETAVSSRSDVSIEPPAEQPAPQWFSRSGRENSDVVAMDKKFTMGPQGVSKDLETAQTNFLYSNSSGRGESQRERESNLGIARSELQAMRDSDGDEDARKKDSQALAPYAYTMPALVPAAPKTSMPSSGTESNTRGFVSVPSPSDSYGMGVGGMGGMGGGMMGGGMGDMSGMMGGMGSGMQRGSERLGEAATQYGVPESAEETASRFGEHDGIALPGGEAAGQQWGFLAKAKSEKKEALFGSQPPSGAPVDAADGALDRFQRVLAEGMARQSAESDHGVSVLADDRAVSHEVTNDALATSKDVPPVDGLFRNSDRTQVQNELGSLPTQLSEPQKVLLQARGVTATPMPEAPAQPVSKPANPSSEFTLPPASRFKVMPVNPWVLTAQDALSTFALDVDTASYALCRQYIQHGFLPPFGAVRMEEFVNAFDYAYPQRSEPTFSVMAEGAPSPFAEPGQALHLVKIAVKARTVGRDQRRAAHLVFVVDASASMGQADRLPLIQQGLNRLVQALDPEDHVSVVSCSDQARLLADHVSTGDQAALIGTVTAIQPSGSTNLMAGLQLGYATARQYFKAGQINQVILCSDGVANVGATEAQSVLEAVAEDRKQGIMLMCVGVGYGAYNDVLLEALANQGDGRYVFVDAMDQVDRVFVQPLAAALQTVAKDARIQVKFDPDTVRRYRLVGYENRDIKDEQFRDDTVDAGEVGSGQCATALYEIELVRGVRGNGSDLGTVFVRYQDTDTHRFEEIARPLTRSVIKTRTVAQSPRFYLAASAARFAEWLRQSEHTRTTTLPQIQRVMDQVSAALPLDQTIQELADLMRQADGLPRAP